MTAGVEALPSKERIEKALKRRFFLRLHMFVILGGTFAAGLVATKVLLALRLTSMAWRYGIAVCLAFAVFLAMIKLWLWYVAWCAASDRRSRGSSSSSSGDWFDCINFGGGGVSFDAAPSVETGGGSFGGGGASGSWGDADDVAAAPSQVAALPVPPPKSSGGGGGGKWLDGLGVDDDFAIILVVIVLAVVIACAAFYVIYAAPVILSEAAFNAALAGALARKTRKIGKDANSWVGSVFRSTFWPFAAVLAVAIFLGWFAQHRCPGATRLSEAIHCGAGSTSVPGLR